MAVCEREGEREREREREREGGGEGKDGEGPGDEEARRVAINLPCLHSLACAPHHRGIDVRLGLVPAN